jgi:small subunit ribosomal protein S20
MPNTSSAKKSTKQAEKRTLINKSCLSRIKTYMKKVTLAIQNNLSKEEIQACFIKAQSEVMKGVTKKVLKLNNASRKISKLHQSVKKIID